MEGYKTMPFISHTLKNSWDITHCKKRWYKLPVAVVCSNKYIFHMSNYISATLLIHWKYELLLRMLLLVKLISFYSLFAQSCSPCGTKTSISRTTGAALKVPRLFRPSLFAWFLNGPHLLRFDWTQWDYSRVNRSWVCPLISMWTSPQRSIVFKPSIKITLELLYCLHQCVGA